VTDTSSFVDESCVVIPLLIRAAQIPLPPPPATVLLDTYAQQLIRYKARRLVRKPGFTTSDQEDVEQDLALHLLRKAKHFEPSRAALNTFVSRVLDSGVIAIIRKRKRLKRAPASHRSLDERVSAKDPAPASASITDADNVRRLQSTASSDVSRFITHEALAHALSCADPQLQELYSNLERGTVASVARELGLSRSKRRALLEAGRSKFNAAGFSNSEK
jgi:RNA polymerase sigma-70 factor (ECF subfamily)